MEWLEKVLVDNLSRSPWIRNQEVVCNLAETPSNRLGSVPRSVDEHRWTSVQREPDRKILFGSKPSNLSDNFDGERTKKNKPFVACHRNRMKVESILLSQPPNGPHILS